MYKEFFQPFSRHYSESYPIELGRLQAQWLNLEGMLSQQRTLTLVLGLRVGSCPTRLGTVGLDLSYDVSLD